MEKCKSASDNNAEYLVEQWKRPIRALLQTGVFLTPPSVAGRSSLATGREILFPHTVLLIVSPH